MRRLAAWLVTAGLALAAAGTAAGCSATPGVAYARGVNTVRPASPSPSAASSSLLASPAAAGQSANASSQSGNATGEPGNATAPATGPAATGEPGNMTAPVTGPAATGSGPAGAPGVSASAGPAIMVAGTPKAVKAKAGILVDAATGQVLWGRNATQVRPIASITKVMTALVVLRAGTPARRLAVPKAAKDYVARYGADAVGLVSGQVFTVDELLHMMLIESAADAAYTLASAYGPGLPAFVAKMNAEAARLGLTHTHFSTPDGLPYPSETATYSTPAELIRLGEAAMSYPEFRAIVRLRYYTLKKGDGHGTYSVTSTNALIDQYTGAVGIKTGFTNVAGHTLLFEAVRGNRILIGDVLGSPATSASSAAQDAAKLLTWAFALKQTR